MAAWRGGEVPRAYAAGYRLHLIVYSGDPEGPVATPHGQACGRGYPLSGRFLDDMRRLARIFAGPAGGPRLYVSLFTEFQTYPVQRQRLERRPRGHRLLPHPQGPLPGHPGDLPPARPQLRASR